jgi:hypothetical protein
MEFTSPALDLRTDISSNSHFEPIRTAPSRPDNTGHPIAVRRPVAMRWTPFHDGYGGYYGYDGYYGYNGYNGYNGYYGYNGYNGYYGYPPMATMVWVDSEIRGIMLENNITN